MSNVKYGVVEEKHSMFGEARISYGIAVYDLPKENGSASITMYISDISNNYNEMEALVRSCNTLHLSPIHLMDVVEDFLVDSLSV